MSRRYTSVFLGLAGALALAVPSVLAQDGDVEPYAACADGTCDIVDSISREHLELTAGDEYEVLFPEDGDSPGDVVCLEGTRGCAIRDPGFSIENAVSTYDGRVVYGAVDADPTGGWKTVNLRSAMTCKPKGSKAISIKVKKATDSGTITRDQDGLAGQSQRRSEAPFRLLRLGPGVYVSMQPFAEAGVEGDMINYYGMLSEDTIAGTSIIRTKVERGGYTTRCFMDRNFDMTRTSGPTGQSPGEGSADEPGEAPGDGSPNGSGGDGPAMVFGVDEVEPIGGDGPAIVIDEDEVEPIGGDGPAMVFDEDEVDE